MAPPSRWSCTPYSVTAADALSRELGLSPVSAAILARRGYTTPESARHFLGRSMPCHLVEILMWIVPCRRCPRALAGVSLRQSRNRVEPAHGITSS